MSRRTSNGQISMHSFNLVDLPKETVRSSEGRVGLGINHNDDKEDDDKEDDDKEDDDIEDDDIEDD